MLLKRRAGVTLTELAVALALFGLIATILLHLLRDHQRFQTGAMQIIETRQSVHGAIDLAIPQLRAVAPQDILAYSDSSLTFRAPLGVAVICALDSTRSILTFSSRGDPPIPILGGGAAPRAGDSMLVLDLAAPWNATADGWRAVAITTDPTPAVCPVAPLGVARRYGGAAGGWAVRVSAPMPPSVDPGTPAWPYHVATLSHYRASSGEWMLGYQSCAGGSCTVRQPLSGPYRPARGGGLVFGLFDTTGVRVTSAAATARVDIIARADSRSPLGMGHQGRSRYADSLAVSIALRNR